MSKYALHTRMITAAMMSSGADEPVRVCVAVGAPWVVAAMAIWPFKLGKQIAGVVNCREGSRQICRFHTLASTSHKPTHIVNIHPLLTHAAIMAVMAEVQLP